MSDTFRYFIRKNFPEMGNELTNEQIDEIAEDFHDHLNNILNEDQKEKIIPKSPIEVIMNSDHPLKVNGFEPGYVLHFTQWIEDEVKKYEEENRED